MKRILLIVICAFVAFTAFAQRTMQGQKFGEVSLHGPLYGGDLLFGGYTRIGYWHAGLDGSMYNVDTTLGDKMNYMDISGSGEYMFRIAGTYNRAFSFYGGGGLFLGYEGLDPFSKFTKDQYPVDEDGNALDSGRFLFGLAPRLELEWFVGRRFALTFAGALPVNFSSQITNVHGIASVGCRFMIGK